MSAADTRHGAVVEEFSTLRKNTLRGFAKIRLASGMILHDVAIHAGNDRIWASPPAKAMLDRDGHVLRDAEGKVRYAPVVAFATKELRDRFSTVVVDAMRETHPEVLP